MNTICPVCNLSEGIVIRKAVRSIYSKKAYDLLYCGNCSHLFTAIDEGVSELDGIYKASYNYGAHLAIENEKKWRSKKTITSIQQFITKDMTIIDIGCMYGFSLEVFRICGYSNLVGIEIDPLSVMKCRGKGFDVFQGTFSEWLKLNQEKLIKKCTCLYLSHVIEHIYNIRSFFQELELFLKDNSCLVIIVPHSDARTVKLFNNNWGWWQVPLHVHHFSEASICLLLSNHGFKIERIFRKGADSLFWLSSIASFLGIKSVSQDVSSIQKLIINFFSIVARYWFHLGTEELIVVARK